MEHRELNLRERRATDDCGAARTKPVMGRIMKTIKDLPLVARRSITSIAVLSLSVGRYLDANLVL
ncbi:hypothetical protein K3727_23315 (plasmid) [Rhodobacteraceae bacterium M382]|nr:hypothetical protein K3727_23315 [Rhodobacteraceae bacterium M382]